jgi:protein TonB
MFEHSLVVRQKSRRRGLVLALAVGLHGAGLATVVLASAWSVGEVPPPEQQAVFMKPIDVTHLVFEQPERPAVPPPGPPPAAPPTPHHDPAPVQPVTPQATQPTVVPNDTPVASTPTDDAPIAEGDAPPSSGPSTGPAIGDAPPGPGWGPGDGDVAQALDARMTRPEVLFKVTPRYTEAARIGHRQGVVIVQATIDRTGHVTDVRLIKGLGLGLDESATNAVQQWRFKPAALAGRPVPVYFQLSVNFTIR